MSPKSIYRRLIGCLGALVLVSCWAPASAQDTSPPLAEPAVAQSLRVVGADGASVAKQDNEAADNELTGTSWRLVKIMSMDDRVYEPVDTSKYTLDFGADGTAAILADCNRGTGTWTTAFSGQLRFGPIAATKSLCPPDSLSEKYLAEFQWVRSYVMENGRLYLATMADGSIIELEPIAPPPAATVLGEEVRTSDPGEMREILLTRLFERYAEEQGIAATDAEVDAYVESLQRGKRAMGLTAEDELTPEEAAQVDQMRQDMARSMVREWKLNRELYLHYGGRIIYQQLGSEPLDAYRQYLEERQTAGDFKVHEKAFEDTFWRYFTDNTMHDFFEPGSEQEARAFATPPWERDEGVE